MLSFFCLNQVHPRTAAHGRVAAQVGATGWNHGGDARVVRLAREPVQSFFYALELNYI